MINFKPKLPSSSLEKSQIFQIKKMINKILENINEKEIKSFIFNKFIKAVIDPKLILKLLRLMNKSKIFCLFELFFSI